MACQFEGGIEPEKAQVGRGEFGGIREEGCRFRSPVPAHQKKGEAAESLPGLCWPSSVPRVCPTGLVLLSLGQS